MTIFEKKSEKGHLVELKKLENDIQDQISLCKSVGVINRHKCVVVEKHAKWILSEWYIDTFSTRCKKDFLPSPYIVPKNHLQNIEKIGLFGDDF